MRTTPTFARTTHMSKPSVPPTKQVVNLSGLSRAHAEGLKHTRLFKGVQKSSTWLR